LPPNFLTPGLYKKEVSSLAKQYGWKMQFLDIKQLKQKKAGAFLAVAQGSPHQDAGILHLRYEPATRSKKNKSLALVGKGICFDTGGTNLKPAKFMHGMHEDMGGSAVALGTLLALSQLKVNFAIDCWLALAENHIGPNAYKQNDIVTASNGTSIEVMHTDAEGRMVLADTLALASKKKPGLIIDYATLTGACVYSLSSRYSGAFTNKEEYIPDIIAAGKNSGERVWPFPMDDDFDKELESKVADIKQCSLGEEADHILASRFLSRFVDNTPWLHIDLSASNNKGGLAHIPTDTTGFGIRFTLEFILNNNKL
jgi:leucyl aminopeptidase